MFCKNRACGRVATSQHWNGLDHQALGDRLLQKILQMIRKFIFFQTLMEKRTSESSMILQRISRRRVRESTNFTIKCRSLCARCGERPTNLYNSPLNVAIWSQITSDCSWASSWLTKDHDDFKRIAMNTSFPRTQSLRVSVQRLVKTLVQSKDAYNMQFLQDFNTFR